MRQIKVVYQGMTWFKSERETDRHEDSVLGAIMEYLLKSFDHIYHLIEIEIKGRHKTNELTKYCKFYERKYLTTK